MPKIVYRLPGEEEDSWADLFNVMYRERNLYLMQEIQDEITNQITGIMTFINLEDDGKKKPINLFINSPGGSVYSGFAIHDTMQIIDPPVHTLCMGLAASMASVITLGGEMTHRLISPSSRILIHQPATAYFDGQARDCIVEATEMLRMRDIVTFLYRQRNGKSIEEITNHLERDLLLTPHEAIHYGIVDGIAIELPIPTRDYYEQDLDGFDDKEDLYDTKPLPIKTEELVTSNGSLTSEDDEINSRFTNRYVMNTDTQPKSRKEKKKELVQSKY